MFWLGVLIASILILIAYVYYVQDPHIQNDSFATMDDSWLDDVLAEEQDMPVKPAFMNVDVRKKGGVAAQVVVSDEQVAESMQNNDGNDWGIDEHSIASLYYSNDCLKSDAEILHPSQSTADTRLFEKMQDMSIKNKKALDNRALWNKNNLIPYVAEELNNAENSVWWENDQYYTQPINEGTRLNL